MTKRMTAEEVLADLQDELHHATEWFEASSQPFDQGLASGFAKAVDLVRDNLVPQWQDEPDGDGEYHVRGIEQVCYVSDDIVWRPTWDMESESARIIEEPLNGRQVCPIGARPQ